MNCKVKCVKNILLSLSYLDQFIYGILSTVNVKTRPFVLLTILANFFVKLRQKNKYDHEWLHILSIITKIPLFNSISVKQEPNRRIDYNFVDDRQR